MYNDRPRDMNKRTNSEHISITLTFSMALAPFQIANNVIAITKNWKKITEPEDCKNSFHTN